MKKIIPNKPYFTSGYFVTYHAIQSMNDRKISKGELGKAIRGKTIFKTHTSVKLKPMHSYRKFAKNKILLVLNPKYRTVVSCYPYGKNTLKKAIRQEKKYVQSKR